MNVQKNLQRDWILQEYKYACKKLGGIKMSVVEMKNVSKKFKNRVIFENVNITIEEGKIIGVVGENGCGKSVLFKMICGFIPFQGEIDVFDKKIGRDVDVPENTGILIETPGFLEEYNQQYNLRYLSAINHKMNEKEINQVLEKVGLDCDNKEKVKKFSLGMRQKLAIAQAIMEEQKLIILDEPMNALDETSVKRIRSLLLDLKKQGKTIILASHIKEDMEILCDEVYRIENKTLKKVV